MRQQLRPATGELEMVALIDELSVADVAIASGAAIRILIEVVLANGGSPEVLMDLADAKANELMGNGRQEASLYFRSIMAILPD